jgi:hypothetical protein
MNSQELYKRRNADRPEAAEIIGCSLSFLDKLRLYDADKSPPFFRVGRRVLYPIEGLHDWMKARTVGGRQRQ